MERAQTPARTLALPLSPERFEALDLARSVIVLACALALIMAGPVLPQ